METYFHGLTQRDSIPQQQEETHLPQDVFASREVQMLILVHGLSDTEKQMVKNVSSSYLLMLETIAIIVRNRKRKDGDPNLIAA